MNKKLLIITLIFFLIIIVLAFITNYVDTGRVTTGHEPKCCIKIVSYDGSKSNTIPVQQAYPHQPLPKNNGPAILATK